MDRRHFLAGSAAALVLPTIPAAAQTLTLGGLKIDILSDGHLTLPPGFIFGPMPQDELKTVLAEHGIAPSAPLTPPCNITLVRDGERVILFDTGGGSAFQPTVGELVDALDAIDVAPEEVTHVVFTHGHPDHLWGVLDDFDDPMFYEAEHMIGRTEWDYWMDEKTVDSIGEPRAAFAVGAKRRLETLEDQITFFDDGDEILSGIVARASFGHTPGHMAFQMQSGSESVMIVGDAIGNSHVAFARPDWLSGSDQDQELAAASRTGLLDQIAQEKMALIGFHLPDGGIGRIERINGGFRFAPLNG